jgi:hypothetical protein
MKLRKILAALVAVALVGGLAITASARQTDLELPEADHVPGVAAIIYYFSSIVGDANGVVDGNVWISTGDGNVSKSVANEGAGFTDQNKDIFLDEGQASIRVDLGGSFTIGGYVGINLWTVGSYEIERYEFLGSDGSLLATVRNGAVTLAAPGTAPIVRDAADGGAKTGVGDVAVASAIALVAAGAVMFSRKKK